MSKCAINIMMLCVFPVSRLHILCLQIFCLPPIAKSAAASRFSLLEKHTHNIMEIFMIKCCFSYLPHSCLVMSSEILYKEKRRHPHGQNKLKSISESLIIILYNIYIFCKKLEDIMPGCSRH